MVNDVSKLKEYIYQESLKSYRRGHYDSLYCVRKAFEMYQATKILDTIKIAEVLEMLKSWEDMALKEYEQGDYSYDESKST